MRQIVIAAAATLLLPLTSAAQDTPRFGVVMGYPAEVGVLIGIVDRLAIRPELNWTHGSTETSSTSTIFSTAGVTTTTVTTTIDTTSTAAGVSGLVYLSRSDALKTYLSPRFLYSRNSSTTTPGVPSISLTGGIPTSGVAPATTVATNTYTVSGSVGAQYSLARRFAAFGELGVTYGRSSLSRTSNALVSQPKSTSTAVRSGAGVILFFGS